MSHEKFITRAYELAQQAVAHGNHPFGALLVHQGQIILEVENTIFTDHDPTAHAETNLVRQAARQFSPEILAESILYTSTEPCIMCSGAIYWTGISQVVYGCAESGLAAVAGDDFLTPCREIFARGQRPIQVTGPVLHEEGMKIHHAYWHKLA